MPNTATRLLTLIQLLQRRPNQKAGDLAATLGVSVRTLHRYLEKLDEMGLPLYSERGPYGGFSLVRGYRLPPLLFSPEEAAALALGAALVSDLWGPLFPEAASGALAKLEGVLPDDQRAEVAWARRTLISSGLRRPDAHQADRWLEILHRATHERRRVILRYRGTTPDGAQEREVDAYALLHRGGWIYLVGYCHLRQAMRSFRLDRIEALALGEERFEPPAEADLQTFLKGQFQEPTGLAARLRFEPGAAFIALGNRLLWERMETCADGGVEVVLRAADLTWAASMALSFGPDVSVLDPPELRRMVAEWAERLAERNGIDAQKRIDFQKQEVNHANPGS
jgi:predicted DNA-binding transcriptional regulator YafY